MTGFAPAVQAVIDARSGGVCEVCGASRAVERHHRRPRGMGGSSLGSTNRASNALHACGGCHRLIEANRALSYLTGWLVPNGKDPSLFPVLRRGDFVLLDDEGGLQ